MGTFWTQPTDNASTVAWMSEPDNRGTLGVVWSCLQTVILCAWVSACVNVPSPGHGFSDLLRDKFYFVLLTLLGPELVFMLAFSQYQIAQESVVLFQKLGIRDWTITHSWYAEMGGIHVVPTNWPSFPVNSKQLHYLVSKGYMECPKIPRQEIKAKSKTDGVANSRVVTIIQTLYFLVNFFARIQQGLFVSTLELTVVGFVFCTLFNSVCWWHKPNDIETSHFFSLKTPIDQILLEAGPDAGLLYRDTPLDFVSQEDWNGGRLWIYYSNILRKLGLLNLIAEPDVMDSRPIQKFRSINFPRPRGTRAAAFILCVGLAYTLSFFGAWHFHFPTRIEALLWKIVICIQTGITFFGGGLELLYLAKTNAHAPIRSAPSEKRKHDQETAADTGTSSKPGFLERCRRFLTKPCNNSDDHHPLLDVPLHSLIIFTPLCAVYVVGRWYLLFEDIAALRQLPESAYVEVTWSKYWPKF